jgi:hypothetical protein
LSYVAPVTHRGVEYVNLYWFESGVDYEKFTNYKEVFINRY